MDSVTRVQSKAIHVSLYTNALAKGICIYVFSSQLWVNNRVDLNIETNLKGKLCIQTTYTMTSYHIPLMVEELGKNIHQDIKVFGYLQSTKKLSHYRQTGKNLTIKMHLKFSSPISNCLGRVSKFFHYKMAY